jgi:hypothetical protein
MRSIKTFRLKNRPLRCVLPGAFALLLAVVSGQPRTCAQTSAPFAGYAGAGRSLSVGPVPASTLTGGLVAHWRLEEAAGARSDSKGTNLLNDSNGVTQGAGKIGQAAKFTKSSVQSLSIADNADLSTGDISFSGSLWVRFDTLGHYQFLMSKGGEYELYLDGIEGNRLKLVVRYAGGGYATVASAAVAAGVWYHVAFWHDAAGDQLGLSINDGPPVTAATAGAPGDTANAFRLGDRWNESLDGRLDEVSFWKRLLSPAERSELYNGGAGVDLLGTAPPTPTGSQWQYTNSNAHYTAGRVGVGTNSPAVALDVAGGINATGAITGGNIAAKYQDLAEWVPSVQKLSAGTVVVLDRARHNHVRASREPYDTAVAGVISAQPGIALGEGGEGRVLVATTGRVRVRVEAADGPIRVGDLLVTSGVEGVAMRSVPMIVGGRAIHRPGSIIGKALEPLERGTAEILVLLSLQ